MCSLVEHLRESGVWRLSPEHEIKCGWVRHAVTPLHHRQRFEIIVTVKDSVGYPRRGKKRAQCTMNAKNWLACKGFQIILLLSNPLLN
jgi:hypothetical protein